MLGKVFARGKKSQTNSSHLPSSPLDNVEYISEPDSEEVEELKTELCKRLKQFHWVKEAYLFSFQGSEHDKGKIALVLEVSVFVDKIKPIVTHSCLSVADIDILFFESLPPSSAEQLKKHCEPIYSQLNDLYECSFVVEREGRDYTLTYCVSARGHESAVVKAVDHLVSQGYAFKRLYNDTVSELDITRWWKDYVLTNWSEHIDYFPNQEEMEFIVLTGGLIVSPCLAPVSGRS